MTQAWCMFHFQRVHEQCHEQSYSPTGQGVANQNVISNSDKGLGILHCETVGVGGSDSLQDWSAELERE